MSGSASQKLFWTLDPPDFEVFRSLYQFLLSIVIPASLHGVGIIMINSCINLCALVRPLGCAKGNLFLLYISGVWQLSKWPVTWIMKFSVSSEV